jgi:hypothetical protein
MRSGMGQGLEEAVRSVTDVAMNRFGLTYGPRIKRRWFLWE